MPTPRPWSSILIDPSAWPGICDAVRAHEGANPACRLGPYWRDRMSAKMAAAVSADLRLPYGFVGDGWPLRLDQSHVVGCDSLDLARCYHRNDLHTRDAGDAIHQGNLLIREIVRRVDERCDSAETWRRRFVVADIGAGYGRLAVPFLWHLGQRVVYLGIDYSPIGLLVAPQFIRQATEADVFGWEVFEEDPFDRAPIPYTHTEGTAWYYSLPAWRLGLVRQRSVHVFAAVHSFQEMEPETVRWYLGWIAEKAAPGALFYSVNTGDEAWLPEVPQRWRVLADDLPVANRDGNYRARLWEIP